MDKKPVVAVFDVGKTNKKLLLFDEQYNVVFERSARFLETKDEDGDSCENLESLRLSVFDSLHEVFRKNEFEIKAINFTTYGASFVYLDENGRPLTPLYNYLKSYPKCLSEQLYKNYGGEEQFSLQTASPALGSLNSGLQLYRMKYEKPEVYNKITHALHLPQYMSYLLSGKMYSDMTSIGCHTALWSFEDEKYHDWVFKEGLDKKLAPILESDQTFSPAFLGNDYVIGIGLHDSSSALIPYLVNFTEPFILLSTGTWAIAFNPFNSSPLSAQELDKDCLFYLNYKGNPVKASRLFLGNEHDIQAKRIADYFGVSPVYFRTLTIDWSFIEKFAYEFNGQLDTFSKLELSIFESPNQAYHALMVALVDAQIQALNLVENPKVPIKRLFVDGGFSKNQIFMSLLANRLNGIEVYAASMAQATALGAAMVIHDQWNSQPVPRDLIHLKYFARKSENGQGN